MKHIYEKWEVNMMLLIGIVGVLAAAGIMLVIRRVMSQNRSLQQWRTQLKRGDPVRVKGYPDEVCFWTNLHNGWAWVRVFPDGVAYKKIFIDEIYPPLGDQ